jgi:hypothetical protein
LADIHRGLLPEEGLRPPADGNVALVEPFFQRVAPGASVDYDVVVVNPFEDSREATVRLTLPEGWAGATEARLEIPGGGSARIPFALTVGPRPGKRQRLAADLTLGTARLGQLGDAVVDVLAEA